MNQRDLKYGKIDPALAETIQKTVWQIVAAYSEAGVGLKTKNGNTEYINHTAFA